MNEPPTTRPPLVRVRPGYALEWLQNLSADELIYWSSRNELEAHIYRKRYQGDRFDTGVVVLGEPKATAACSVEELIARNLVGAYGWRRMGIAEWLLASYATAGGAAVWWAREAWRRWVQGNG